MVHCDSGCRCLGAANQRREKKQQLNYDAAEQQHVCGPSQKVKKKRKKKKGGGPAKRPSDQVKPPEPVWNWICCEITYLKTNKTAEIVRTAFGCVDLNFASDFT